MKKDWEWILSQELSNVLELFMEFLQLFEDFLLLFMNKLKIYYCNL